MSKLVRSAPFPQSGWGPSDLWVSSDLTHQHCSILDPPSALISFVYSYLHTVQCPLSGAQRDSKGHSAVPCLPPRGALWTVLSPETYPDRFLHSQHPLPHAATTGWF